MKRGFNKEKFALTLFFIAVALVLLFISIYKIIKEKDLNAASIETTILFFISLFYLLYRLLKDKEFIPTNIKGEFLTIKQTKKDKNSRKKSYLIESIVFAIFVVFLDLIAILFFKDSANIFKISNNGNLNILLNSLITFVICLVVSYSFEYIIGESSVKKANKKDKI